MVKSACIYSLLLDYSKIPLWCDSCRVSELLDYTSEELTGRNLYALCHAEDVNKLRKCHVDCKLMIILMIIFLFSPSPQIHPILFCSLLLLLPASTSNPLSIIIAYFPTQLYFLEYVISAQSTKSLMINLFLIGLYCKENRASVLYVF